MDRYGNIFAVWVQGMEILHVWACRYTPDGGWAAPRQLDSLTTPVTFAPEIAVNSSGYATVVWNQDSGDASTSQTWAARYEDIAK